MNINILQELKSYTQQYHEKLERNELLKSLALPTLDYNTYLKILTHFYGFFAPLEKIIKENTQLSFYLPDFPTRRKSSLLLADINSIAEIIGIEPDIKICKDLPEIKNVSDAFGCVYVMEGSTLGGQLIYKSLEKSLQISSEKGASFFYGYGSETGARWKVFKQKFLDFSNSEEADHKTVVHAALETFEKLDKWFKN
ncbi:biliverdin-producing heme oxygenase [soil metagenome]